jgi:hypothetical protein
LLYALPFLRSALPPSPVYPGLYAVALGVLGAAVVLWTVSRLEEFLTRHTLYRIFRHLVRLSLLGLTTVAVIEKVGQLPYNLTLKGIAPLLETPRNLAIVFGVIIASHFILWNWKGARAFWHRRLAGARLRSSAA